MQNNATSKNIVCYKSIGVVGTKNEGVADIRYFLKCMFYLLVFPFPFLIKVS